jgi:hypothetical protein
MRNLKIIVYILVFYIATGCGFKIVETSKLNKFQIIEIKNDGDNKINFLIRSKIYNLLNLENSNDKLKIKLSTEKKKSVKEKNNKNQITKYTISIKSVIDFDFINQNVKKRFVVLKEGSYDVDKNHNNTLKNLKNLENNLSEKISSEITFNLIKIINEL